MRWLAIFAAAFLPVETASAQRWSSGPAYPAIVQRPAITPLIGPLAPMAQPPMAEAAPAWARSPDLLGVCILLTPLEGRLSTGGDLKSWATQTPATITVTNTGSAQLIVTPPTQWALSPQTTPDTNFSVAGSLTGVNVGNLLGLGGAVSAILTGLGLSVLSVSLGATAATPFPSGSYAAQVTVTCVSQ